MRKLIVTEFVSLDGVMQAPGGEPGHPHTGWVGELFSDELFAYKSAEQLGVQTLLLGRTTFESFLASWPEREGEMADKINTMEKVVVSTTLADPDWAGSTVVRTLDAVRELRAGDGGDLLVVGSRTLAQSLLQAGLVDQVNLQVFPVVLGSGDRFFPDSPDKLTLSLESSEITSNGVMLQEYLVGADDD